MERSPIVHALAFVYLCAVVSLILSCYRQDDLPTILRETARRSVKFAGFILVLALAALAVQRLALDP